MRKTLFLTTFLFLAVFLFAQDTGFDIAKAGTVDKAKSIGVIKERKDKYGYNSQIEAALLKQGFNVTSGYSSVYVIEYLVGPQPVRRGSDDFTFRIKLYESNGGKLIATASVVKHNKNDILDNLPRYINDFLNRVSAND